MSRPRGGFIGHNPAPAASAINSAAGGIWTLREAQSLKRAGTWPQVFSSPTQISGLQLWLDASDASTLYDATTGGSLVAADGGVARWEDKSGNGRHMTQGTAGSRPARKTAVQGGLDVLRFDGSADFMSVPSSTAMFNFLHASAATVFVLFKPSGANPDTYYTVIDNSLVRDNNGYYLSYDDRASESSNDKIISQSNNFTTAANNFCPANTFNCVTNVLKGQDGVASNRSVLYRNGIASAATNSATGSYTGNASGNLTLGATYTGILLLNGDIAEILIYNSALSDTDRQSVENYLMAKWGI